MDAQEFTTEAPIAREDVTPESIAEIVIEPGVKFARRVHRDTKLVDCESKGLLAMFARKKVPDTDSPLVWRFHDDCFDEEVLELPGDYNEAQVIAAYASYHAGLDRGIELGKRRRDDEIKSMVADLRGLGIGTTIETE